MYGFRPGEIILTGVGHGGAGGSCSVSSAQGGNGEVIIYTGAVPQVVADQMRASLVRRGLCAYCGRRSAADVHGNCPGCGSPKD